MQKIKVLIVSSEFPPQPGGIGNHAYNLALALEARNYDVKIIADQRSEAGTEEQEFDRSLAFDVIRIKRSKPRLLMYFHRLFKLFKYAKSANKIIATGKFSLWSVAFMSWFLNRQSYGVVHGTEVNLKNLILRKITNWSLSRFIKVIAVSSYTKSLIDHLNIDIKVIPNGIDFAQWETKFKTENAIKGHPKLITVGNVTSRKGQQNVINHLPHLIEIYPKIHYHCIGLKTEVPNNLRLANALHVQDYLTFHGRVDEENLVMLLQEADIFVMLSSETSTGDVEGFGIAILEANALGIPAIGSLGCGIEDAILPYKSGMLVPYNDAEKFAEAIKTILYDRAHFRTDAVAWAKKHDWSEIVSAYIDILK